MSLGVLCSWFLVERNKNHTWYHMGKSVRQIWLETSSNTISAYSNLQLTNFRSRFLSSLGNLSSFSPPLIIKSFCEPTKTCSWPKEVHVPLKWEESLFASSSVSWWCYLIWSEIDGFTSFMRIGCEQLSPPPFLHRKNNKVTQSS